MNIRALHLMMSPTVEEYAEKRMSSLNRLVTDAQVVCDIRLSRVTPRHRSMEHMYRAEVSLGIGRENIFAHSEKEDLYQAVDDVRDQLERILSSRKKKKVTSFRKGALYIKQMLKNRGLMPSRKKELGV